MYALLRRLFFLLPAETAHYVAMNLLKAACALPPLRAMLRASFRGPQLPKQSFGLQFRNPVGLGAGFDKNARYLRELEVLGFGFVEIGTVTPKPQAGNDKPRLFRLPKDGALINRMGFNNDGVEAVTTRLKKWRAKELAAGHRSFSVGGNIGKNKSTPNEDAWKDYITCFSALHPYVDFFVVNVSSPNTPGLRALQERDALHGILTRLQELNRSASVQRPILLKIAPDLTEPQLDEVVDLALEIGLDGLVASNTTIDRSGLNTDQQSVADIGAGGLSGKPLRERSTAVLQHLTKRASGSIPIIGSGGIFTAADAKEKLDAGATLVEVWTGFIYEGPTIAKRICAGLVDMV
ncbi:MAG: quinone-dependent dihydroorotate dehydrogenase [Chitinophagaceae bacterium]|nr:MAG: quinone-dependent dihydroorotate dehydrogenase [Chitinophagaceae bacterium]